MDIRFGEKSWGQDVIAALLGDFLPYIAAAGAAIAAIVVAYFKGGAAAKAKAETRGLRETIKAHEARNEADDSANAEPDPHGKLRDDWSR